MSKHLAHRDWIKQQWATLDDTALGKGRFEDYDEFEYLMKERNCNEQRLRQKSSQNDIRKIDKNSNR